MARTLANGRKLGKGSKVAATMKRKAAKRKVQAKAISKSQKEATARAAKRKASAKVKRQVAGLAGRMRKVLDDAARERPQEPAANMALVPSEPPSPPSPPLPSEEPSGPPASDADFASGLDPSEERAQLEGDDAAREAEDTSHLDDDEL